MLSSGNPLVAVDWWTCGIGDGFAVGVGGTVGTGMAVGVGPGAVADDRLVPDVGQGVEVGVGPVTEAKVDNVFTEEDNSLGPGEMPSGKLVLSTEPASLMFKPGAGVSSCA